MKRFMVSNSLKPIGYFVFHKV